MGANKLKEIKQVISCEAGSIGPKDIGIKVIVDPYVAAMGEFVCGANENGYHITGANIERDVSDYTIADIRNITEGEINPADGGQVQIRRGIEVGHIFALGQKYSDAMKATVLNEQGKAVTMTMGCYGIGVSRIVAAAIEQNYDDKGIIWPEAIAPYSVAIVPMNMGKSERVAKVANELYDQLLQAGVDVIIDDRNERPGVMFKDMELIGVPHRITIGDRSLDKDSVEYFNRASGDKIDITVDNMLNFIKDKLIQS